MPMPTAPPPPGCTSASVGLDLHLANLCRSVRTGRRLRTVLSEVTLHIPAGTFVGVLGASGSGKSTLIRVIAGLDRAASGQIRVAGIPCTAHQLLTDRRIS